MVMVGSGGSFSTATFAADLHESATGQLARAVTPLDVVSKADRDAGLACFSANGRNPDILTAFRVAATREMEPLSALVLAEHSPLEEAWSSNSAMRTLCAWDTHPSRTASSRWPRWWVPPVLLVRAYRAVFGRSESDLPERRSRLDPASHLVRQTCRIFVHRDRIGSCMDAAYVSVLYSSELAAAAVDLESRFVEAALGALHIADLRNFGHGRHFWMARKAHDTGVLALISESQEDLGTRTVSLLPDEVTTLPIHFRGSADVQGMAGLVVGLFVADERS